MFEDFLKVLQEIIDKNENKRIKIHIEYVPLQSYYNQQSPVSCLFSMVVILEKLDNCFYRKFAGVISHHYIRSQSTLRADGQNISQKKLVSNVFSIL